MMVDINEGTGNAFPLTETRAVTGRGTPDIAISAPIVDPTTDGRHNYPRAGFITNGPRVGKIRIIRVL